MDKIKKILLEDNVKIKNNKINLDHIIENIIESTNLKLYKNNLCHKLQLSKDIEYVSIDIFEQILNSTNKSKAKKYIKYIKSIKKNKEITTYDFCLFELESESVPVNIPIQNNSVITLDLDPNKFTYIVDVNNTAWFRADNFYQILGFDSLDSLLYEIDESNLLENINYQQKSLIKYGNRKTIYLKEQSLYELIGRCRSSNPIVKKFKNWLYNDLIPQIRKTGKYQIKQMQYKYDINNYDKKSVIYIIYIIDDLYKFGITDNLRNRLITLKKDINFQYVVKLYDVENFRDAKTVESKIKHQIKSLGIASIYKSKTEIIKVTDEYPIDYIIDMTDKYVRDLASDEIIRLRKEISDLKNSKSKN
jgi:prophage antirepressor-like protein